MPRHFLKLAVSDKEAPQMLSLSTTVFKELVREGVLPGPSANFAGRKRWSMASLSAIAEGARLQEEDFEP
ncbi:hypothetical protein [Rhodovulum sulfidophilum]|uniref:hypothetical protein n=1 Tax=Rhodovulum sulfidophilum TaxID=35806 RepID=UPI001F342DF1|nr:hypothetical protein [Rhodovulum sulfidophilum]MCE8438495.1 hypothetical protein [Rhodovulum sulfidophilum]MCE8469112.1 hypothetical protein [Rhodovulum sulfidophilum]